MNKQEAETIRAESQTLAKELGIGGSREWVWKSFLAFAEECRAGMLKLKQEQEQERIDQMVEAFAPMDDWEMEE